MVYNIKEGQGHGFIDEFGFCCMERCFKCGKENWAPAVATGKCGWCGYDANSTKEIKEE